MHLPIPACSLFIRTLPTCCRVCASRRGTYVDRESSCCDRTRSDKIESLVPRHFGIDVGNEAPLEAPDRALWLYGCVAVGSRSTLLPDDGCILPTTRPYRTKGQQVRCKRGLRLEFIQNSVCARSGNGETNLGSRQCLPRQYK